MNRHNKIKLSRNVAPLCLPGKKKYLNNIKTYDGKNVVIAGWGLTSHEGKTSSVLQKVTLTVMNHGECKRRYKKNATVTDRMICAKGSGRDSCQGDSGGKCFVCPKNSNRLFFPKGGFKI